MQSKHGCQPDRCVTFSEGDLKELVTSRFSGNDDPEMLTIERSHSFEFLERVESIFVVGIG
jgi:hypothetical protein